MKKTRILSAVLALVLALALLAGCGGSAAPASSGGSTPSSNGGNAPTATASGEALPLTELKLPLCEEKQELTVWMAYSGTVMSDLNEIEGVKRLEELTNVHINWIPVNQDEVDQKFGTLVASGKYPDIVYPTQYPGGEEAAMEDGFAHPDTDFLIRNYMPNYMRLLGTNVEARREATADSGKMIVVRTLVGQDKTVESEGTYTGLAYRADILEELGMDVPTTVDEWHEVFVAAKAAGVDYPLELDNHGGSALALSWGVPTQVVGPRYLAVKNDKVFCGQATEAYKGYLDTMRQWYSEGLIDPNFTTFHFYLDTPGSVDRNQSMMYSMVISNFTGNNYFNYHMINNDKAYLQPIAAPALKAGDETIGYGARKAAKGPIFITSQCKNPELAAQWLDFLYTEEGQNLLWYGIEGVTYEKDENGIPQFLDSVINNSEGMSPTDYLQRYALNMGTCYLGRHVISAPAKISAAISGGQNYEADAVAIWSAPAENLYLSESITLTDEEITAVSSKLTSLQTMIDEYTVSYIVGQDVKPFEEFQKDLNDFGLQTVLDNYQAAYDRYLAR